MSQVEKADTVVAELRARRESLVAHGHSLAQQLPQMGGEARKRHCAQARRERKRGRVMSSIPTPGIHRGGCGHYWPRYSGALECPTCAEVAELKAGIIDHSRIVLQDFGSASMANDEHAAIPEKGMHAWNSGGVRSGGARRRWPGLVSWPSRTRRT